MNANEIAPNDIIHGAYRDNPIVHAAINIWMRGGCTWEQAMMYAVTILVQQIENLEKIAEVKISHSMVPPLLEVKDV